MRLAYLKVQGFRCFAEKQHIQFPATGIIPIIGSRADGGSSGSGKSSVLQAIAYVLGFSSFSAKRMQSWLPDAEDMQVDLGLETEDGQEKLEIRRGKKNEALLNGHRVASGATELAAWMLSYFGMPSAQLQTMTFRPQRKGGLFLGLGPGERRLFLASILGFKRFEDLADSLTKEVTAIEKRLEIQEAVLERTVVPNRPPDPVKTLDWNDIFFRGTIDVELDDPLPASTYESQRLEQEKLIAVVDQQQKQARQRMETSRAAYLKESSATAASRDAAVASVVTRAVTHHDEALKTAEERLQLLEGKSRELDAEARALTDKMFAGQRAIAAANKTCDEAEAALKRVSQLVTSLQEQKCHTCGQHWLDEAVLETSLKSQETATQILDLRMKAVVEATAQLAAAEEQMKTLEARRTKVAAGLTQLRTLAQELRTKKNAELMAAHQEAEKTRNDIRTSWNADIEALSKKYHDEQYEIQRELGDYDLQVSRLMDRLQKIEANADYCRQSITSARRTNAALKELWAARTAAEKNVEALEKQILALQTELDEKRDLQSATRAFLGAISQEVLAEIRDEANVMLAVLPNVPGVGIRFTTETQTDSGSLRQEIRAVLTYGREDDVDPESQLSGGQLTSVELAVDRAVSRVLRRRRGGFRLPSWMALDESFDGHDLVTKEACLDFLRAETLDTQVFIIDHASEFREAFEHQIHVQGSPSGSKITIS